MEAREGRRIGREEIGKRVGKALATEPIPQSTVASWFGEILPPADVGVGVAVVYGVKAGWLYFGEDDADSAPVKVPAERETPPRVLQHSAKKRRRG